MSERPVENQRDTYFAAATEHVSAARELHDARHYVLSHYVAGLAVECLFRAFKARTNPVFDERHDLYELAKASRFLDSLESRRASALSAAIGVVSTRWQNSHRYRSQKSLRRFLTNRKLFSRKGELLKDSSRKIINAALEVVSHGVAQWKT